MATMFGMLMLELELFWKNVRLFAFNNRTVFEIFFITLYSLIQLALVIAVELAPRNITFIVSIFAILVLSVFALHKLLMESRIKILENQVADLQMEKQVIIYKSREVFNKYFTIVRNHSKYPQKSQNLNRNTYRKKKMN